MRTLSKNRMPYWYALYEGVERVTDANGRYTGEQIVKYSEPVKCYGNISASKGDAYTAQFGTFVDYDCIICATDTKLDENSVLWINKKPTEPYDYRVQRISRSLNSVLIAIKRVEVGA